MVGAMSEELVSVRMIAVSGFAPDRDLLRQAAGAAAVPIEFSEANGARTAAEAIARGADLVFVDMVLPQPERVAVIRLAEQAPVRPYIALIAPLACDPARVTCDQGANGVVRRPADLREATAMMERCARVKVPGRVLLVDDSKTMRSIVRKILEASLFSLTITEAEEGIIALRQIDQGEFDVVFLDYNMPGLNGVETLSEIKRKHPKIEVVVMTSAQDEALAEQARAAGAAGFLKKPFYPSDIDAVLLRGHAA